MSYQYLDIDVEDLYLNPKNYRIDFVRFKTPEMVIDRLYEDEAIIDLMRRIVDFGGLYPNDLLIAIHKDDSKYTVLEGNRRLLAIKSLLGLIDVPPRYERKVKELSSKLSQQSKDSLKRLKVVVYDKKDGDPLKIIAAKHSSINYESWEQISQWHFYKDLFEANNRDIDETSKQLGKNKSEVVNFIHYYNLLYYIRLLEYWDNEGMRDQIEKNRLKPTKFTRPLGSKSVLRELNIEFSEDLELKVPQNNKDEFDYILFKYAEASLIKDTTDDDSIYTRTEMDSVIDLIRVWKEEHKKNNQEDQTDLNKSNEVKANYGEQSSNVNQIIKISVEPKPRGRKKAIYFQSLRCTIEDSRLIALTNELSKISVTKFPAATIMLTRSLLEASLLYQIEKKNLKKDYYVYDGKDGLKKILNFSIKKKAELFSDPKSASGLEYLETSKYKDFMDDVVHSKWIVPEKGDVSNIAGKIRKLIQAIISDKA